MTSHDNIDEPTSLPHIMCQQINILYDCHEMLSEPMLTQEINKIQNLVEAKREFNERKDLNFYITAEDLLKIQNLKGSKINIKLSVDPETSSKRSSPRHQTKSHNVIASSAIHHNLLGLQSKSAASSLVNSEENLNIRKARRTSSVGNEKRVEPRSSHPQSGDKPRDHEKLAIPKSTESTPTTSPRLLHKPITISQGKIGHTFLVSYAEPQHTPRLYSTFVIEKRGEVDGCLLCKGLIDSEVSGFAMDGYNKFQFSYPTLGVEFQLMSQTPQLVPIKCLYIHILTLDKECTVTQIVDNLQNLLTIK